MKNKSLSIAGISALGLALVGSAAANAYTGTSGQNNTSMTGRNFDSERHAQMQEVLDTTDFTTWKDLVSKTPMGSKILEVVNENNFSQYVEMQRLLRSGDVAGAEAIRAELGLPERGPKNATMGRGHFDKGQNNAVRDAIENNDYSAWKEAVAEMPNGDNMLSKINESNFSQLVEMHNLLQSGDRDGADAIRESLGLQLPPFEGRGPEDRGQKGQFNHEDEINALESGDFNAWKEAVGDTPMGEKLLETINESNFSQFAEMHELMQSGDREGADAIRESLGLERPEMNEHHGQMMRGQRNQTSTQTQN